MDRANRRRLNRQLERENSKYPETLQSIPPSNWPEAPPPGLMRVFRSRDWFVQVFNASLPALVRITVNRTTLADGSNWQDGITWDDLQAIKNEVGYEDHDAVEIFPAARDLVNVASMRHLWVLAEKCPFAWRRQGVRP